MTQISTHIAKVLKARRQELGLTLDDVAARCGTSKSHIWTIEAGRNSNPTISMALSLCDALSISLNQLLGMDVAQPKFSPSEMALIAAHRKIFGAEADNCMWEDRPCDCGGGNCTLLYGLKGTAQ